MCRRTLTCLPALLAALIMPSVVAAQEAGDISALKSSSSISATQAQQLAQWIEAQVRTMGRTQEELNRFVAAFTPLTDETASRAFRDALAEQAARRFAELSVSRNPPRARAVARVLVMLRSPNAMNLLFELVNNDDEATRYLAALGLKSALTGTAGADPELLDRLRRAVLSEATALVRRELCLALAETGEPAARLRAFGEIIAARADAFRRSGIDDAGELLDLFAVIEQLNAQRFDSVVPADRAPAVAALANLLHYAIHVYVNHDELGSDAEGYLKLLVGRTESAVIALTGSRGGNITQAVHSEDSDSAANAQNQLRAWIGDPDNEGALNRDPWNLPRGGGFPAIAGP